MTGQLDFILDAGTLKGGLGSTVVDVTVTPPQVLREGQVQAGDILGIFTEV
jgi:L-threonylcarbamoyladenylate synthase